MHDRAIKVEDLLLDIGLNRRSPLASLIPILCPVPRDSVTGIRGRALESDLATNGVAIETRGWLSGEAKPAGTIWQGFKLYDV